MAARAGELAALVEERLDACRPFLVELALKVAERVLHTALDRGDYDLGPVVSRLVERARNVVGGGAILVLVNPADLAAVLERLQAEGDGAALDPAVRFEAVPRIPRGSCQVQTDAGRLLFAPEEFLAQAGELVREELAGDGPIS
jgi:flagellar biosynthesis/type III secretory pathway protein FliH